MVPWMSEYFTILLQLAGIKKIVSEMSGRDVQEIRVVISPYRICPLGAHIDHQGGPAPAMTINKGILLGVVPSGDTQVVLHSGQFKGEVRFRVNETQYSIRPLRRTEKLIRMILLNPQKNLTGGVGVAYLLALESANNLTLSPTENIEYDPVTENEYLGLRNRILDQSAILLSSYGCLTCMICKTKEHKLIHPPNWQKDQKTEKKKCQEAARFLLHNLGSDELEPLLCNGKYFVQV
ncbi:hypothetical protein SLE2022_149850 [Rubroshorea leprosula]